jgi:hypothetical protein
VVDDALAVGTPAEGPVSTCAVTRRRFFQWVQRADGIVKSMLEHSRGVSGERRVVDLNVLIEEALNLAYHGARAQDGSFNITLEREFDRGLAPTELAPQEMTRVFLNLFGNGFYATTKRQRDGTRPDFRPTLKVATRDLGDAVDVRVRDNGTDIAPEIRAQIVPALCYDKADRRRHRARPVDRSTLGSGRRSAEGHEERFPSPSLSGRCRLGQATFIGTDGKGREAPKAVIGQASIELVKSTHVRHPRNIILRPKPVTR